jgi:hypothetical protein
MKVYEAEKAAYEAHEAATKARMKNATKGTGDTVAMASAIADLQALQPPEMPFQRRFKSNDSTVEKLGDLADQEPPRAAGVPG